ncbi:MAG: TIGR02757 family protein [Cytophagales bacterium]|nr:MAG: TIGR02757 family protein [Cytophagales bacterium]
MKFAELKLFLDQKYEQYNSLKFIEEDPILIPHLFTKKQDIEIMGFWVAILAWGQRKTIINKAKDLITRMDGVPHDFVINHQASDAKKLLGFKHRTFNDTDALYFLSFFQKYYQKHESLEQCFSKVLSPKSSSVEMGLVNFKNIFFDDEFAPTRTYKHVASPAQSSSCKRINMFLRWMVRKDNKGVDFGIWKGIKTSQLVCPCDVHVDRVARKLGLIKRKSTDWHTALELTKNLKKFDAQDPVKYDFALFGLGVDEKL